MQNRFRMFQLLTALLVVIGCPSQSQSRPVFRYSQPPINRYGNYHNKTAISTIHKPPANHRVQKSYTNDEFSPDFGGNANFLNDRRSDSVSKSGIKERGLDIGVHLNMPTTKNSTEENNLKKLNELIEKAQKVLLGRADIFNISGCPSCEEEETPESPVKRTLKPAYRCDEWDFKSRICILERNIGDTVTFYLSIGNKSNGHRPNVTWKKEFHIRDSKERKELVINPENSPENIIIGKRGFELRVSPITEIDVGFNLFSATIDGRNFVLSKVMFMIRIVPVDLGFVYVGETIELNLRSYVSLPGESVSFKWYMEKDGEHGTLPSNMRISETGGSIKISELRQEQEGILACSIYTNLNFLATKKRFLLKDLVRSKNTDVLKSAPDHNLPFKEATDREKRDPKAVPREKRGPKAVSILSKRETDMNDLIEKALMESTTTEKYYVTSSTEKYTTSSYKDYNLDMDVGRGEFGTKNFDNFRQNPEYSAGGFQDVSQNEDFPDTKQIDLSVDSGPEEVEEPQGMASIPGENGEVPKNENAALDDISQQSIEKNQPAYLANQYPSKQQVGIAPYYQSPRPGYGFSNKQLSSNQNQIILPNKIAEKGRKQYVDIDIQTGKGGKYVPPNEKSEIILNIDKIPRQRRISAEEAVAKLISFCYSDFECSESAICVQSSMKMPGFCKCLSGFYGVGIFCREDIWMSNSNSEIEDLRNSEDIQFSNDSPLQQNK